MMLIVGVLGTTMHIDNNGDSEGNFSVLALNEKSFQVGNFTCSYQMVPVATFHAGGKDDNILVSIKFNVK